MKSSQKKGHKAQGVRRYALLRAFAILFAILHTNPVLVKAEEAVVTEQKDSTPSNILDEVVVRGEAINMNLQSI